MAADDTEVVPPEKSAKILTFKTRRVFLMQ